MADAAAKCDKAGQRWAEMGRVSGNATCQNKCIQMRPCSLVALWRCQFVKGAKPASEMWQVESNDEKIGIHMNHDES